MRVLIFIFVLIIILAILTICIKYLDSKTVNHSKSDKYFKIANIMNIISVALILIIAITLIGSTITPPGRKPFQ